MIPAVEPQTIDSILGASEKWFIIPATYILVEGEGRCAAGDVGAAARGGSTYILLRTSWRLNLLETVTGEIGSLLYVTPRVRC